MRADYRANYDQIAADHIAHWRSSGGGNPWQPPEQVEETIAATLALIEKYSQPNDVMLDAGCGIGELLARVEDRRLFGCDFAQPYLDLIVERGIEARVVWGELESLPYLDVQFDVVVATDVLEHVLDLNTVIAELLRVLKPGGHLVIRSPNNEDLAPYLDPAYPYRFVHLRHFSLASLTLLFTRVFGCEVVEGELVHDGIEVQVVVRKP
jgi:SAM-dependent methyltransferase